MNFKDIDSKEMTSGEKVEVLIETILLLLILPIIYFGLGFIIGLIIKLFIGNLIVNGALALGIIITTNDIPLIWGTLMAVASIFE